MDIVNLCFNHAVEYANKRIVAIWGECKNAYILQEKLQEIGFRTVIMDGDEVKVDEINILSPFLCDDYYYLIPIPFYNEIRNAIRKAKKIRKMDYYCPYDDVVIENQNYYEDSRGNKVYGNRKGLQLLFYGNNSIIVIKECNRRRSCTVEIYSNCILNIDEEVEMRKGTRFIMTDNTVLHISKNVLLYNDNRILLQPNSKIDIGEGTTIGRCSNVYSDSDTEISINNDCMFSWDVSIKSSNGHKLVINGEPKSRLTNITIGQHVWLGMGVTVLGDSCIGDGSIVGAKSFVKGVFGSKKLIVGVPAKEIDENVEWERNIE